MRKAVREELEEIARNCFQNYCREHPIPPELVGTVGIRDENDRIVVYITAYPKTENARYGLARDLWNPLPQPVLQITVNEADKVAHLEELITPPW